jgi:hydroxymethylglutaryl-CoA reductase
MTNSSVPKFHEKTREERVRILEFFSNLSKHDIEILKSNGGLTFNLSDNMIENAIGDVSYPL